MINLLRTGAKREVNMTVNIICPDCHSKMVYQGGNVMVTLNPDEVDKIQKVEAHKCQKCGKIQTDFYFKFNLDNLKL